MIIEHVHLKIKTNQSVAFEQAFQQAKKIIAPMKGLNPDTQTVQVLEPIYAPLYTFEILEERIAAADSADSVKVQGAEWCRYCPSGQRAALVQRWRAEL